MSQDGLSGGEKIYREPPIPGLDVPVVHLSPTDEIVAADSQAQPFDPFLDKLFELAKTAQAERLSRCSGPSLGHNSPWANYHSQLNKMLTGQSGRLPDVKWHLLTASDQSS